MKLFQAFGQFAGQAVATTPGMVLLTPSSIAHTGTSASIGANGQITFSGLDVLSVNGIFTSSYDNYVITGRVSGSGDGNLFMRVRSSGTDATGSDYIYQAAYASSTSLSAARSTSTAMFAAKFATTGAAFWSVMYGPATTEKTNLKTYVTTTESTIFLRQDAGVHAVGSAYDGFTLYDGGAQTFDGSIQIYGLRS